jgi:hypothetical protein
LADLRVVHPRFQSKSLMVRPGGWGAPKLVLNGDVQERSKGSYQVLDDQGKLAVVKLKSGIDPIPKLDLDGEILQVARPLAWYEYAWAAWPFGLVAVGGALGGGLGAGAAIVNLKIMRAELSAPGRFAACAAVGVVTVVLYVVLAGLLVAATGRA